MIQHQLLFCCEACAVACRQAVVFIQHVDLHFQHPPLALPRGVGTRFAVAVMQVALGVRVGAKWSVLTPVMVIVWRGAGARGALRNAECGFRSSPSI